MHVYHKTNSANQNSSCKHKDEHMASVKIPTVTMFCKHTVLYYYSNLDKHHYKDFHRAQYTEIALDNDMVVGIFFDWSDFFYSENAGS